MRLSRFFNWFCFLFQIRFSSSADDSNFSSLRISHSSINSKWFFNCLLHCDQSDDLFNELIFVAFARWLLIDISSSSRTNWVNDLTINASGKFWDNKSWDEVWLSSSDVRSRSEFSRGEFWDEVVWFSPWSEFSPSD
jgi:hypothetical protein